MSLELRDKNIAFQGMWNKDFSDGIVTWAPEMTAAMRVDRYVVLGHTEYFHFSRKN